MKPDPIAQIDIVEVAKIAASIPTPGLGPFDKIREAYQMLAIANQVKSVSARTGFSAFWILDSEFEEVDEPEKSPEMLELESIESKRGNTNTPIPLADCLRELMPQVAKPAMRSKRFGDYLVAPSGGNWGQGMSRPGAAKALERYQREGVPWDEFTAHFHSFRHWWPLQKSNAKAKAGKAKKGRPRKKNDKRKGARAGNFLQALKKTA